MASWLIPALKAVIPHVGDILSAAKPVFTKKKPEAQPGAAPGAAPASADLVQQQIAELQAVASQQSAHIKELAAQLENTVSALEKAAALAEERLRRVLIFTALSAALSIAALAVAFVAALTR
jgi:hypothetical protein